MHAPASLCRARAHTVQEDDLALPFPHPHGGQPQLGQLAGEGGEFMEMGGEEGAGAQTVMQRLQHRPGDGEAIPCRGAAPHLIENDKAARPGLVQDGRRLGHFHHEGGTPAGQIIRGADAGE